MSKLLLKLSVALVAISLMIPVANAETPPRKKGFFEGLFGVQLRSNKQPRRPLMRSGRDREDGTRSLFGSAPDEARPSAPPRQAVFSEPDAAVPGLGLGNLDYIPPKLVPLYEAGLIATANDDALSQAIKAELSNPSTTIMVVSENRKPLLDVYKNENMQSLWLRDNKPSERALKALAVAAKANEDGLDPRAYLPDGLTSYDNIEAQLGTDPQKLAHFDIAMTAATLKLAQDLSGGQFDPTKLSKYNDITPPRAAPVAALDVLALTPTPELYFDDLRPKHPAYSAFKAELAKLRASQGGDQIVIMPQGKTVKPDMTDKRIPLLRTRLQALGFLPATGVIFGSEAEQFNNDLLDIPLSQALIAYQESVNIPATGQLDNVTVKKLNPVDDKQQQDLLIVNLERLRWLPRDLGNKHVFVNQPAYTVDVMDQGKPIWHSKVIVGRPTTQTAAFHDEIETVVFNPTWGVPQSIIVNEYLKKLVRDPGYLDREGFTVVDPRGNVVSSASVNWGAYSKARPYSVIQSAGSDNALGELKFLFPNSHDIYMHDTPNRELFAKDERAFSHGCVRVENPRDFAAVLLSWDRAKVDAETDPGENHSLRLEAKVPVHITYFTAWPNDQGQIQFYDDIYKRDEAMVKALATIRSQYSEPSSPHIVQN